MRCAATRLNRREHRLVDFPFVGQVKQFYPAARDFFGMKNLAAGTYVVCRWVDEQRGLFHEVMAEESPRAFTRADFNEIGAQLHPRRVRSYRAWARARLDEYRKWQARQAELHMLNHSIKDFIARRHFTAHEREANPHLMADFPFLVPEDF